MVVPASRGATDWSNPAEKRRRIAGVCPTLRPAPKSLKSSRLGRAKSGNGITSRALLFSGRMLVRSRGEGSDIDVLVEFGSAAVLFDFVGLSQYLEERPGSRVDVVPAAALRRPEIRGHVVRDLLFA